MVEMPSAVLFWFFPAGHGYLYYITHQNMPSALNLSNRKFGRLTAIARNFKQANKVGYALWECLCDCGNQVVVTGKNLVTGNTQSCGCLRKEISKTRVTAQNHARRGTGLRVKHLVEYTALANAKARCVGAAYRPDFHNYGGRGIRFEFSSIREGTKWVLDNLGERPDGYSLDRIDTNGHYAPGNLRWATVSQQKYNQRCKRIEHFTDAELQAELSRRCLTS